MGALTLPAWKSFFKKYLNRSAAHLLTEERTPIDPGVTAMCGTLPSSKSKWTWHQGRGPMVFGFGLWQFYHQLRVCRRTLPSLQGEIRGGQEWWNILSLSEHLWWTWPIIVHIIRLAPLVWFFPLADVCQQKTLQEYTHQYPQRMQSSKGCQRKGATSMSALYMFFFWVLMKHMISTRDFAVLETCPECCYWNRWQWNNG